MKIFRFLLFICCIAVFTSCTSFGKKYSPDSMHEVYYKGDGVDESNAKKLADYLKEQSYFQADHKATVQIEKIKDTFNLNFAYDKTSVNADREAKFLAFGGLISKNVFNGAPVTINLCDENLKSFRNLGYAPTAP